MTDKSGDPLSVLEDEQVAQVLRRLYAEACRQHVSIIRHFLPHTLHAAYRFMPFEQSEMVGFYAGKYIAIEESGLLLPDVAGKAGHHHR